MAEQKHGGRCVVEVTLRQERVLRIHVANREMGMDFVKLAVDSKSTWVTLTPGARSTDDALVIRTADIVAIAVRDDA